MIGGVAARIRRAAADEMYLELGVISSGELRAWYLDAWRRRRKVIRAAARRRKQRRGWR